MNRTLVVSDLHGIYPLWRQIIESLDETDTLYILGDCGDRGRDGWKIICEALKDPRVVYIRGNHDQMLLDSWREEWYGEDFQCWMSNGGWETYDNMLMCDNYENYLIQLAKTKLYHCYVNKEGQRIHLSHAGFTLMEDDAIPHRDDLLWDREHCLDHCNWWPEENPTDYMVHGHTPVKSSTFKYAILKEPNRYKANETFTVVRYAHGHKIGIDGGCFATGKCAVLDLDTLTETIFEIPNFIP